MRLLLPILTLLIFAGAFNGAADRELFHRDYLGSETWKNKYAQPFQAAPDNWYYRTYNLPYRERFPLSATLLVSLTDRWHAYKAISAFFLRMVIVALALALIAQPLHLSRKEKLLAGIVTYITAWALHGIGFHTIYSLNIF